MVTTSFWLAIGIYVAAGAVQTDVSDPVPTKAACEAQVAEQQKRVDASDQVVASALYCIEVPFDKLVKHPAITKPDFKPAPNHGSKPNFM